MIDPFTQVYRALWKILEEDKGVTNLLRKGNRINFAKDRESDPRKPGLLPADSPELSILPDFFQSLNPQDNNENSINRNYQLVIRTATVMLNEDLQPLEWALYRALTTDKQIDKLKQMCSFVRSVQLMNGVQTLPEIEDATTFKIRAWRSVWNLEIEMAFNRRDD